MINIYLVRHGQDVDNSQGVLNGHRNTPLTEKGVKQAQETAEKIKAFDLSFDVIFSSPLIRALETTSLISEKTKSPKPIEEALLIERNFGVMTGKNTADIEKLCGPDILKAEIITYFLNPEGAETFPDLMNRGRLLLSKLQENYKEGNILLVTHGDVGKMIYAEYYHLDWKLVLTQFHFGNAELLLLADNSPAENAHIFKVEQYNH